MAGAAGRCEYRHARWLRADLLRPARGRAGGGRGGAGMRETNRARPHPRTSADRYGGGDVARRSARRCACVVVCSRVLARYWALGAHTGRTMNLVHRAAPTARKSNKDGSLWYRTLERIPDRICRSVPMVLRRTVRRKEGWRPVVRNPCTREPRCQRHRSGEVA